LFVAAFAALGEPYQKAGHGFGGYLWGGQRLSELLCLERIVRATLRHLDGQCRPKKSQAYGLALCWRSARRPSSIAC